MLKKLLVISLCLLFVNGCSGMKHHHKDTRCSKSCKQECPYKKDKKECPYAKKKTQCTKSACSKDTCKCPECGKSTCSKGNAKDEGCSCPGKK